MKRPIDFMIIGAQKSGTTALFTYLSQHPSIFLPHVKDVHFFVQDEFYSQGSRYLEALYRRVDAQVLLGGADVELMYFEQAAERLHAYNPEMRLLAVLRNPIDRAYSGYWFARSLGVEDAKTFEAALAREERRRGGTFAERSKLTYLAHGYYAQQLTRFLRFFDFAQMKVVLAEDLWNETGDTLQQTLSWLRVSPELDSIDIERRVNVASRPRLGVLQSLLRPTDSRLKRILRKLLPYRFRYWILNYIRRPLAEWNLKPFVYPPMDSDTRARLQEHFSSHNVRLERLLARDLSHWT